MILRKLAFKLCLVSVTLASTAGLAHGDLRPDLRGFEETVEPLLKRYCVRCHGDKKSKADIRLDTIDPDLVNGEHFDQWEDIREAFNSGEMPPKGQRQPTSAERDVITRWLDSEFKKVKQSGVPDRRGKVRRLTRYELQHALEDLLGVSITDEISALPEEGTSVETGLKNSARMLMISGPHLESYLNVILSVTNKVKEIATFEPYTERLDIEHLETNPEQTFTRDKRKIKPPVGGIEREGKGVVIDPKGYIDLPIPVISKYMFQTLVSANGNAPGELHVDIGYTRSDIDPRQNLAALGVIEIQESEHPKKYTLTSFPESLPREMTRALDRPFFIRITNRGRHSIYLESFDYKGNVNAGLTERLIPDGIGNSDVVYHVRQKISNFIEKAFRRPPTDAELQKYFQVFREKAESDEAIFALLSTYKEILCSPRFFYIGLPTELSVESDQNYKLAERLAFFLWCSVPDDLLMKAASDGELTKPQVVASHVDRMLRDERSKRFVEQLTDQWLQTSKLFNVAVDRSYYPRFRAPIKDLMHQETVLAIDDVFRNGSSALDLLDADHVFVNQTLAAHYGIKGVRGRDFQKVGVDEKTHRGGLLTQATFLIGNSDGMNSHAILRGVWLSEVILNDPPPDPPKNVPPLDESIPGFNKMTLNQKLFAHRNNDACKHCHKKIDPWGIPFENFDASGAWREKALVVTKETVQVEVPGKKRKRKRTAIKKSLVAIDRRASLPDETIVDGIDELKDYLVTHRKRDFAKGLTERILAYAISRDIDYHDEEFINQLTDDFERNDYSVPILIRDIVQSDAFR